MSVNQKYKCTGCELTAPTSAEIDRHFRVTHPHRYQCQICYYTTPVDTSLLQHYAQAHPGSAAPLFFHQWMMPYQPAPGVVFEVPPEDPAGADSGDGGSVEGDDTHDSIEGQQQGVNNV
jgi:hypothetical protein